MITAKKPLFYFELKRNEKTRSEKDLVLLLNIEVREKKSDWM